MPSLLYSISYTAAPGGYPVLSAYMKIKADTPDVSALLNYLYLIISWNLDKFENFPVISDYFHTFLYSELSFAENRNSTSPIRNITDSALTPILILPVT